MRASCQCNALLVARNQEPSWHEILQEHYKKEESEISIETTDPLGDRAGRGQPIAQALGPLKRAVAPSQVEHALKLEVRLEDKGGAPVLQQR